MRSIYTLASNYDGRYHSVSYHPAGSGSSFKGCVTNLEQYKQELKETYNEISFKLMHINSSSEVKEIEDNDDLLKAAKKLNNGTHLFITLCEDLDTESSDDEDSNKNTSNSEEDGHRYKNDLDATLKRFVHTEGKCHHCPSTDGLHYQWSKNSGYYMCEGCFDDDPGWEILELPWEDDVPSYPLSRERGHPTRKGVCHLQYLLTRFGFMPLSATEDRIGSWQSNTERAVEKFRRDYKIYGRNMGFYNEKMAEKLCEIVRKRRTEGHKYL